MLLLYDKNKSFMWKYRKEILAALEDLKTKNMMYKSKTIDQYLDYEKTRREIIEFKLKKA